MARHLVSGCDVWLNTPMRPHEASGTSGQKASLNGAAQLAASSTAGGTRATTATTAGPSATRASTRTTRPATRPTPTRSTPCSESEVVPLYYDRGLDDDAPRLGRGDERGDQDCRARLQHAPHGQGVRRVSSTCPLSPSARASTPTTTAGARAGRVGASVSASTGQMSRSRSRGRAMVSSKSVSRSR